MKRLFLICSVLFLLSCEKEIQNTTEDYVPYVVVNSIISADSTLFSVNLTYSKSIYDTSDFKPVENASVYISVKEDEEDKTTQDFFLDYQGNGTYSRRNQPIGGRRYEMIIETEDGQTITAETYVPRVLRATVLTDSKSSSLDPETNQVSVSVDIEINEENDDENYYAWDLVPILEKAEINPDVTIDETDKDTEVGEVVTSGNEEEVESPTESNDIDLAAGILVTRDEGLGAAVPALADAGGKITASFDGIELKGKGETGVDTNTGSTTTASQGGIKYKLKVWAISYDYYNYLLSVQQNSIGNSDATFQGPYSNVTNGSGIFAGYNYEEFEVEF